MESKNELVISIRNLRMIYGDRYILRGINLDVYQGEIIGYIGPNGAGKSTTIKSMLGLVEGFTGEIRIFGNDISNGDINYKSRSFPLMILKFTSTNRAMAFIDR
jgi:ABC-2 type transport system ATP-binding protein